MKQNKKSKKVYVTALAGFSCNGLHRRLKNTCFVTATCSVFPIVGKDRKKWKNFYFVLNGTNRELCFFENEKVSFMPQTECVSHYEKTGFLACATTKTQIRYAITAQLISFFVFTRHIVHLSFLKTQISSL